MVDDAMYENLLDNSDSYLLTITFRCTAEIQITHDLNKITTKGIIKVYKLIDHTDCGEIFVTMNDQ